MLRYVTFGEMETGSHICQLLHIKRSKCVENQNWWRHFKQKNAWAWQLESGCVCFLKNTAQMARHNPATACEKLPYFPQHHHIWKVSAGKKAKHDSNWNHNIGVEIKGKVKDEGSGTNLAKDKTMLSRCNKTNY